MVVSTDVPDEIMRKIDALIKGGEPPVWPFKTRTVIPAGLPPTEKRKLDAFLKAKSEFDAAECDASALRSRSAVLRMILMAYFKYTPPKKPPVTPTAVYQRQRQKRHREAMTKNLTVVPISTSAEQI